MSDLVALLFAGSIWLNLFVICVIFGGILASNFDTVVAGFLFIVFTIIGLHAFDYPVVSHVDIGLGGAILMGFVYLMIGSAYGVLYRYPRFLNSRRDSINSAYKTFLSQDKVDLTSHDTVQAQFISSYYYRTFTPKHNADRISNWVLMWPWALFWDLTHRPFIWLYKGVYKILESILNNISEAVVGRIIRDSNKE